MSRQEERSEQESSSARAYGGMTSEERRQQRRERLIEAGLEVFGRRGLSQSTMRDICTHARLSDRYFYESFASVQDVFEAVYVHLRTQLLTRLYEAMRLKQEGRKVGVAEAGLHAFFSFVHEDPRRARIMLIDVLGLRYSHLGEGVGHAHGVYQVKPYIGLFGAFFHKLYPGLDGMGVDIELILHNLIGMTVQSAAAWADKGFDKSVDDMVRHNLFAWEGLDEWFQRISTGHAQQAG